MIGKRLQSWTATTPESRPRRVRNELGSSLPPFALRSSRSRFSWLALPKLRERLEGQTAHASLSALRDACAELVSARPLSLERRLLRANGGNDHEVFAQAAPRVSHSPPRRPPRIGARAPPVPPRHTIRPMVEPQLSIPHGQSSPAEKVINHEASGGGSDHERVAQGEVRKS